jgi:hypothetical protein
MFTARDVSAAARVVVLGSIAAERLFGAGIDPVKQSLTIRNEAFTVVGVTDTQARALDIMQIPTTNHASSK